jgi:hypothetical protein
MTTFFLIAGFFAHMTFHKRGAGAFVRDRLKRIAVPLVVGWPILLVAILLASGYAVYVTTGTFPTKPPPSPPGPPLSFPLTHLWFLYVLLWLYTATLLVRGLVARLDHGQRLRRGVDAAVRALTTTPAAALVLALPVAAAFWASPDWLAWFGVPTPDSNLIPNPIASIQFGLAFGLGWLIHRQAEPILAAMKRRWLPNLVAAVALTAFLLIDLGPTPVVRPDPMGSAARLVHAGAYALCVWTWTFAAIGAGLRFLNDESRVRRYIADSSYWIYLIHLPLLIVLQAWVSRLDWPWWVKFPALLGVGFALMFASYELLVRHTFIGAILNGRRAPWRTTRVATATLETAR